MRGGSTLLPELSVTARMLDVNASDFPQEIDRRIEAIQRLAQWAKEEVERETLKPIEAIKVVACGTGSVFGYEEFHPRGVPGTPESLVSALYAGLGSQS